MTEFEFTLPTPTESTIKRCNEMLAVYCFKSIADLLKPEQVEIFVRSTAMLFGLKDKDIACLLSLTKNDITMFTVREVCVCAYYLSNYGIKAQEILRMFGIKKSKYMQSLRMYAAYDNFEELQPKIMSENMLKINGCILQLSSLSEKIITAYKTLNKMSKGEIESE